MVQRAPVGRVGLVATFGLLLVTGCSGGASPSRSFASASPSASASGEAAAEQAAVEAYRGMWDAFVAASVNPDPNQPDLARYATGTALSSIVTALTENKQKGYTTKGSLTMSPQIQSVEPADSPTRVNVLDCVDDSKWLRYDASGTALQGPGGRRRVTAVVTNVGGWKVESFAAQEPGTC